MYLDSSITNGMSSTHQYDQEFSSRFGPLKKNVLIPILKIRHNFNMILSTLNQNWFILEYLLNIGYTSIVNELQLRYTREKKIDLQLIFVTKKCCLQLKKIIYNYFSIANKNFSSSVNIWFHLGSPN
jgi:hypothetical protein